MPTPRLTVERYADEIVTQAGLLAADLEGADLRTPVPSCPGWNLAQLTQHVAEGFVWVEELVRTRASAPPDDRAMRDLDPDPSATPGARAEAVTAGAARLAATLREAGPSAPLWTPLGEGGSGFFARRFAHETVIHRADAALALDRPLEVAEDVAVDGLAEWMELGGLPVMLTVYPERAELLGPGHTLRVEATDADAAWFVDLTGSTMVHRPAGPDEPAAAVLRGPLVTLLHVLYARLPLEASGTEIDGDAELLRRWWSLSSFG